MSGLLLAACCAPALAADQLKFGPAPAWAVPGAIPAAGNSSADAPVAILLTSEQLKFEAGKTTLYSESAVKILNAQGLAVGNISIPWNPATDSVTVNKLLIRRGDKVIDVLAGGQSFSTMRREGNLETATLDGRLTANIQPEGLRVGDIIHFATTIEHSDPILQGHIEASFANWDGAPIKRAQARVIWPDDVKLRFRKSNGLPQPKRRSEAKLNIIEMSLDDVEPVIPPKGAPLRFAIGRLAEASDFATWAEVADLMAPLYREAAAVPASGPLREEVERISSQTSDPLLRAELALMLVQDRIRYVALLMGEGGYVPASAEQTWSRRFGDCKAKTALLLALLHELDVEAAPVLVNSEIGDALGDRLPMLSLFNHVLVRARIGGRDYWLDGTRSGDGALADIEVPNFRWALPVVPNAQLTSLLPPPLALPSIDSAVVIDASAGIYAPARFKATRTIRGDAARAFQAGLANLSAAQLDQGLREFWRSSYDYVTIKSATSGYDKAKSELRLSMAGDARLEWKDGWLFVPDSTLAFEPNFERQPGPARDAPFAVGYPNFSRARVSIQFPKGFAPEGTAVPAPVKETLAGVEFARIVSLNDGLFTLERSERSLRPEVSYEDALGAAPRLKALHEDQVYLKVPARYRPTDADIEARRGDKPASAAAFFDRGLVFLDTGKLDEAIADFSAALKLKPNDAWALANRGIASVWKNDVAGAEKDLAAAEAIDGDNPVAARARGLLAERQGNAQAAVDAYSRSLQKQPGNGFALARRGAAYHMLRDPDRALADLDQALKAGYDNPGVRLLRANIFRARGDREATLREADAMAATKPESGFGLVAAAKTYASYGLREKAMQTFDRALAVEPKAYVYINRADSRPKSDFAGRLADLDAALRLEPASYEALSAKALLLKTEGRHAEAVKLYDALLELDMPASLDVTANRAVALHEVGRTAEAEKAFADLRLEAKTAVEFNNLCWAKATANILLELALEECREALRLKPDAGAYLDSLGLVLLRLGRLEEALATYDKAVAMNTGASSLMGRAMVHARKGDVARANADAAGARNIDWQIDAEFAEYGLTLEAAPKAVVAR